MRITGDGRLYNREELYDLIWSKPIQQLAKEFGMSDVALAKKCKVLGIPRPGRGYWAKVEAGKKVRKSNLPKRTGDRPEKIWIATRLVVKMEVVKLNQEVLDEIEKLQVPENRIKVLSDFKGAQRIDTKHPKITNLRSCKRVRSRVQGSRRRAMSEHQC